MTEAQGDSGTAAQVAAVAIFRKDLGAWEGETEITPAPGADPVHMKSVATSRLVGDRWLVVDVETDSGFAGHGVYGWDVAKGEYVGVWVDSMQASPAIGRGEWDDAAQTMTYHVEAWHDGQTVRYREVTEHRADGSQVYRNLLAMPDGSEFQMMRTVYHRRG